MAKRCDIDRDKVDSACTQFASECKRACRELLAGLRLNEPATGTTSVTVEPDDISVTTYSSTGGNYRPSFTSLRSKSIDSENAFNYLKRKEQSSSKKEVRFTLSEEKNFRPAKKPANAHQPKQIPRSGSILVPIREEIFDIPAKAETIVDETIINAVEAIQKRLAPNSINQPENLRCSTHCEQPCATRNAIPKPNGGRLPANRSPKDNVFKN